MTRPLLILSLGLTLAGHALAFPVYFKDGDSMDAVSFTVNGGKFTITPPPAAGATPKVVEAGALQHVDLPVPASFTEAMSQNKAGEKIKALIAISKARADLEPMKNISGPHDYWIELEFLRANLLLDQKRTKDIEASMTEISRDTSDAPAASRAKVFLAHLGGIEGNPKKAIEDLNALIKETTDNEALADAWLFLANHLMGTNDHHGALLAFLRIPVFYAESDLQLSAARLGAARCYLAIEDPKRAYDALKELLAKHPASPETAEAKKLLAQVSKDLKIEAPAGAAPAEKPVAKPADTPEEKTAPDNSTETK